MRGVLFILLAELCFASSSVLAKLALIDSDLSGIQITFFRFIMGAAVGFIAIKRSKESFRPKNPKFVFWRAITNTTSAMLFFFSLKYTSVTNANMLGMTYPLWVVIFAPLLIKEQLLKRNLVYVFIAIIGVYLVVMPDFSGINLGDACAFMAGVTGAVAVIILRRARQYDSTNIIIFYLMFTGAIINSLFLPAVWAKPTTEQWFYILTSAILGLAAQIFLTVGYKYIEASQGSLVSSSRIVMAAIMGVIIFSDDITIRLICGALLILSAQYGIIQTKLRFATKKLLTSK